MNNSVGGFGFVLKCFEIFDLDGHILGTVQRCLSFMRLSDKNSSMAPVYLGSRIERFSQVVGFTVQG
jgi:hypothetical protein